MMMRGRKIGRKQEGQRGKQRETGKRKTLRIHPHFGFLSLPTFLSLFFLSPLLLFFLTLLLLLSACGVPLYKVAPIPQNVPIEAGKTVTVDELDVTAAALVEDDTAFERFEANLPLAGIVAVEMQLRNRATVATKSLNFALLDSTGKTFPLLDAKKQLKQMMKFEGVRLYSIAGRQQTIDQLQSIALPKKLILSAQEERRGVLFFHAKQDVAQLKGLTLIVKGGKQPITLRLT